jgi:hypothetical protein
VSALSAAMSAKYLIPSSSIRLLGDQIALSHQQLHDAVMIFSE